MKFFRFLMQSAAIVLFMFSCKKENKDLWKVELEKTQENVQITDISKEYFDSNVSLEEFKAKYPWFQGSVSNEDFANRRKNPAEIKAYQFAASKTDLVKLSKELAELFTRVKYYFPKFQNPKVYTFSSSTQMYEEPIIFDPQQGVLFIDISSFMGEKSEFYKGIEDYYRVRMNPENMLSKISETIAFSIVPYSKTEQKFLDQMVYNGKMMTLQDAFLPTVADHLKLGATAKQYEWDKEHEVEIWDYFVENDYLYSPDPRLIERFITPGPFSKFYTEVDNQSSPQVGVFTGWQICKKFYQEKPETKLIDFVKMSANDIFKDSGYKPKK